MNMGWSVVHIEGSQVIAFQLRCTSVPKDCLIEANSADPDKMHNEAFFVYQSTHLGVSSIRMVNM